MGYIIEVSEDKVSGLAEHIGKALRHAGRAMECIEEMYDGEYGYGERGRYGERDDYEDDDWRDDDRMGERRYGRGRGMGYRRRRRDSRGRYE